MYDVSASLRWTGSVPNATDSVGSAVDSAVESRNSMNSALATAMDASREPRVDVGTEGPVEAVAVETDTSFSMRMPRPSPVTPV